MGMLGIDFRYQG